MQHDSAPQQASDEENQEVGLITALMNSITQILRRYILQWETSKEILHLEWAITRKSLWYSLVVLIVFAGFVLSACIALTGLLAYALYTQGMPFWGITVTLIAWHGVALFTLAHMARGLAKRMGFHRSVAFFQTSKLKLPDTQNSAKSDQKESQGAV